VAERTELLFSYGTLRLPAVQQATFGRLLEGEDDAIIGYRVESLTITDPDVLETSGESEHPVLVSGDAAAEVDGTVFEITADELAAADSYEVDDYERVAVPARSGRTVWAYVART
jgi:gamma-glutamylcyclotransferase (GGCT)/AIG2-like uncharacterized protein YtfP